MNPLLSGMNDKQAEAVVTTEGPLLIMAGAGSGKTRVLTHRVAHLIKDLNVMPWRILAITFTNKAAREMKERISQLIDENEADAVWVSTFHALAVRILRRDIDKLGYKKDFSIIDASAQRTLVKRILKDQNVDIEKFTPRSVLGAISNAKNAMERPEDYLKRAEAKEVTLDQRPNTLLGDCRRRNPPCNAEDNVCVEHLAIEDWLGGY